MRKRVADLEEKVEDYRASNGLLEGAGAPLQAQQLTDLNTQLSAAMWRARRPARAANLEKLVNANGTADAAAGPRRKCCNRP